MHFLLLIAKENICVAAIELAASNAPPERYIYMGSNLTTPTAKQKAPSVRMVLLFWWGMVDSNHRRHSQQIYSLSPLATREIPHIQFRSLEPVDGLVKSRCDSVKPSSTTLIRVVFHFRVKIS